MMKISEIISLLENLAPPAWQEDYDNSGLLTGHRNNEVAGILCTLDCTEEVVEEAIGKGCNLIIAHHPIIFRGLKKITGSNYVERTVIKAIRNDIAIYAIHTNLDHVQNGVNKIICDKLGIKDPEILQPKQNALLKLAVFTPHDHVLKVQNAMFTAGAGHIGNYSECSFNLKGEGTFKAGEEADPFVGKQGQRHLEPETKVEVVLPAHLKNKVIEALKKAHPYEEVALDLYPIQNPLMNVGAGMVGRLEKPMEEHKFLNHLKSVFGKNSGGYFIKHTPLKNKPVSKVAVCGGSGSFLLKEALKSGADVFITADFKYHEFFDAEGQIVIADVGHFESEQFTPQLLAEYLENHIKKINTFAVRLSEVVTNPIKYF